MNRTKLAELLPFWNELMEQEQELLVNGSVIKQFEKGKIVHQSHQDCTGMLLILSGQLRTYIVSEEGREVTLFRVSDNEMCVLSAECLMKEIPFDVIIDAIVDTKVLMLPHEVLSLCIEKNPKIETYLYRTATERFSDAIWTVQQILFYNVDRRVANFLWDEITRTNEMTIRLTHDEIARYIGSAREVVTKVLKYFAQEGVVSLSRGKIEVISKEMIKKFL